MKLIYIKLLLSLICYNTILASDSDKNSAPTTICSDELKISRRAFTSYFIKIPTGISINSTFSMLSLIKKTKQVSTNNVIQLFSGLSEARIKSQQSVMLKKSYYKQLHLLALNLDKQWIHKIESVLLSEPFSNPHDTYSGLLTNGVEPAKADIYSMTEEGLAILKSSRFSNSFDVALNIIEKRIYTNSIKDTKYKKQLVSNLYKTAPTKNGILKINNAIIKSNANNFVLNNSSLHEVINDTKKEDLEKLFLSITDLYIKHFKKQLYSKLSHDKITPKFTKQTYIDTKSILTNAKLHCSTKISNKIKQQLNNILRISLDLEHKLRVINGTESRFYELTSLYTAIIHNQNLDTITNKDIIVFNTNPSTKLWGVIKEPLDNGIVIMLFNHEDIVINFKNAKNQYIKKIL